VAVKQPSILRLIMLMTIICFVDDLVQHKVTEPLNGRLLDEARKKRMCEKQVWTMLKEGWFYFMFLLLVSFITWGSRNPMLYHSSEAILNQFSGRNTDHFLDSVRLSSLH